MNIIRTKEELKSLTRVANKSSLLRIFLLSSNVERSIDADSNDHVQGQIEFNGELLEKGDTHFYSKVSLTVKGLTDKDKVVVKITCDYFLNYDLKPGSETLEEDLINFCKTNALYNAWPFIREFIHSTCNRMEIPSIILPLLKIIPPKRETKESKDEKLIDKKSEKNNSDK